MGRKKPYEERSDLERIESQWRKLSGLHSREEWSAAVVRAATAAEIATNLAIRAEFAARSQFDLKFVNSLLTWGNGITGKIDRLLLPLVAANKNSGAIKKAASSVRALNDQRNLIVHRGEFCSKEKAGSAILAAERYISAILAVYCPDFVLKPVADTARDSQPG